MTKVQFFLVLKLFNKLHKFQFSIDFKADFGASNQLTETNSAKFGVYASLETNFAFKPTKVLRLVQQGDGNKSLDHCARLMSAVRSVLARRRKYQAEKLGKKRYIVLLCRISNSLHLSILPMHLSVQSYTRLPLFLASKFCFIALSTRFHDKCFYYFFFKTARATATISIFFFLFSVTYFKNRTYTLCLRVKAAIFQVQK